MRRSILANSAALLGGILVCLLLGESAVRTLQHYGWMQPVSVDTETSLDTRAAHPELNAALVPSADPLLGWEPDPHDRNVNADGMRGAPAAIDPAPGAFRIAVLGDSYAYGFSVPAADAFPAQLETLLARGRRRAIRSKSSTSA